MDRVVAIPSILREVALKVEEAKDSRSIYLDDKGFLSNSDLIAHDAFVENIKNLFPDDRIFSEEGKESDFYLKSDSHFTWVVDPICGTTNFVNSIPFYSHSITLVEANQVIAAGVFDPSRNEMFYSNGQDFYINDKKHILNNKKKLSEALISFNTNQSNFDDKKNSLESILDRIAPPICRRVHILESANLELAYVAAGRIDIYVNPTDKPWDIAAAKIFLSSAGGDYKIIHSEYEDILQQQGIIAAGSQSLLGEVEKLL